MITIPEWLYMVYQMGSIYTWGLFCFALILFFGIRWMYPIEVRVRKQMGAGEIIINDRARIKKTKLGEEFKFLHFKRAMAMPSTNSIIPKSKRTYHIIIFEDNQGNRLPLSLGDKSTLIYDGNPEVIRMYDTLMTEKIDKRYNASQKTWDRVLPYIPFVMSCLFGIIVIFIAVKYGSTAIVSGVKDQMNSYVGKLIPGAG